MNARPREIWLRAPQSYELPPPGGRRGISSRSKELQDRRQLDSTIPEKLLTTRDRDARYPPLEMTMAVAWGDEER